MKKLFILIGFAGLGLTACKKDYTCRCTSEDGNYSSSETITDTRNDAEASCDEGDGSVGGYSVNCEIE
jgi:hypothetical protein